MVYQTSFYGAIYISTNAQKTTIHGTTSKCIYVEKKRHIAVATKLKEQARVGLAIGPKRLATLGKRLASSKGGRKLTEAPLNKTSKPVQQQQQQMARKGAKTWFCGTATASYRNFEDFASF